MSIRNLSIAAAVACMALSLAACGGGGSKKPAETPTPAVPGAIETLADWVRTNRNVDFVGNCADAQPGVDVGKLCATVAGTRGTRQAYYLGPTFSENTALAILEQSVQDQTWSVLSVTNRDPSAGGIPGIPWPLQVGDQVVIIGLGEADCLSIREQPTQSANKSNCMPDGTKAIIQEGPVDAETFTWWRIAGDGFNGWAAGTWMRLPEAIAQALTPPTATPAP
jgi:hypothetical protein